MISRTVKVEVIIPFTVSISKFPIFIVSAHAYLSRNWRAITWVSNYRQTLNWIPVIGHLRYSCVNHVHLGGFFLTVFLLFEKMIEYHFGQILPNLETGY